MSYHSEMRTLSICQQMYDNMAPPDPDDLPDGCREDDYEDYDDDDGYDGILGEG